MSSAFQHLCTTPMNLLFLISICLLLNTEVISAFTFHKFTPGSNAKTVAWLPLKSHVEKDPFGADETRRQVLTTVIAIGSSIGFVPTVALAKGLSPDAAYKNLVAAREELKEAGRTYLAKKDFDGLREYLDEQAVNMNNYESNAQALLESKRLDKESKQEIGTIRRYGVGADVIIMYGGLKGEIMEDMEVVNYGEVQKYFVRTLDSLNEVITICRNNGFE